MYPQKRGDRDNAVVEHRRQKNRIILIEIIMRWNPDE